MDKRVWPIILIIFCFVLLLAYIFLTDLNYRQESIYRDIQFETYHVYSDWFRYVGTLRGILLTPVGISETLNQAERQKDKVEERMVKLEAIADGVDLEIINSLSAFIGSIKGGLELGQELIDNGRRFIAQPDLPEAFREGRIGISSLTGKDITSVMGPLASYEYYQLVRRLKGMNILLDQMYSDQLELFLNSITERAEKVRYVFFLIRMGLLTVIVTAISLLIFRLFRLNRFLHKLADSTKKELDSTKSYLSEVQGNLKDAQFQNSLFEMVTGISHELNTPLGNCVTLSSHIEDKLEHLSDLMDQNKKSFPTISQTFKQTFKGVELLQNNLEKMKIQIDTFKQLSSVNNEYEGSIISLVDYISREVPLLISQSEGNVKFQIDSKSVPDIPIRYAYLNQIFSQLIDNSLEHGNATEIGLYFQKTENKQLYIRFQNNGEPISQAQLDNITTPFFTTDRGGRHMGLGLSIVSSLITHKLHGNIVFENKKGHLIIHISLPLESLKD